MQQPKSFTVVTRYITRHDSVIIHAYGPYSRGTANNIRSWIEFLYADLPTGRIEVKVTRLIDSTMVKVQPHSMKGWKD